VAGGGVRVVSAADAGVGFARPWGSALRAGVLSSCFAKKKVAKEEGDPRVGAGYAGPLRYSPLAGAAELGATPLRQSSPFFRQRLRCSAPLRGARKASRGQTPSEKQNVTVDPKKCPKLKSPSSATDGLPGPLGGAEQRRNAGGSRRGLFEGQRPEFRSRPAFRVAQGTGAAGTDPGSPFLCLLSFGEAKESKTPRKGGTQRQISA
jgi:hypothetical protein